MLEPDYSARNRWQVVADRTALLLVDVQNTEISAETREGKAEYYRHIVETSIPNQKKLIDAARSAGIEVLYTVIEALTKDGRDRSLDHKLCNFLIPKGSDLARVIEDVAPQEDDMVFPKTSSGVFNSTNIDYVLRNLGVETLIICGFLTDQCVDMAIRDAADKGYYVICVDDACATHSKERHQNALAAFQGYCRIANTDELVGLFNKL